MGCAAGAPQDDPAAWVPLPLTTRAGAPNPLQTELVARWDGLRSRARHPELFRSAADLFDGRPSAFGPLLVPLADGERPDAVTVATAGEATAPVRWRVRLGPDGRRWLRITPQRPLPPGRVRWAIAGVGTRPWGDCLGTDTECAEAPDGSLVIHATVPDWRAPMAAAIKRMPAATVAATRPIDPFVGGPAVTAVVLGLEEYRSPDGPAGGVLALDDVAPGAGRPVTATAWVMIPGGTPAGWVLYAHGLAGTRRRPSLYREFLDDGLAVVSLPELRHRGRHDQLGADNPLNRATAFFNLANLPMTRDNLRQMYIDVARTVRAIPAIADALGTESPAGAVGYVGTSLGCMVGSAASALVPEIRATTCFVGGARIADLFERGAFGILYTTLQLDVGGLRAPAWQPFVSLLIQRGLDAADPGVLAGPEPALSAFRLHVALGDQIMPNRASLALARALDLGLLDRPVAPFDVLPPAPGISGVRLHRYPDRSGAARHGGPSGDRAVVAEAAAFMRASLAPPPLEPLRPPPPR